MVYKRRRYSRKRRPFSKKVKSVILKNAETKHLTYVDSTNLATGVWSLHDPVQISQGDDSFNRDGNKVWLRGIWINLFQQNLSTLSSGLFRIMVVWSQEQLPTSIFPANVSLPYETDHYYVLYDKTKYLQRLATQGDGFMLKKYIRLNRRQLFQNSGATSYTRGRLTIAIRQESGATCTKELVCETYFKEL